MAKKKSKPAKSAPKDFSNNPFKSLKGLSDFEAQNPCNKTSQGNVEPVQSEGDKDRNSFAEEMAFLGVKQLRDDGQTGPANVEMNNDEVSETVSNSDESDTAVFLDAIGSMEKAFKDEWCGDLPEKRAEPRRMKQVERGQLLPEDELDLHGLTVDEAKTKAHFFLQNAIYHGFATVLLITGKGLHSASGPVLRSAMETFLSENHEQVVEWGVAPRRFGGEGALVVFLRQPGQKEP